MQRSSHVPIDDFEGEDVEHELQFVGRDGVHDPEGRSARPCFQTRVIDPDANPGDPGTTSVPLRVTHGLPAGEIGHHRLP